MGGKKAGVLRGLRMRLLQIEDSPGKVALGVAIGVFIAWSPTWGFHMIIALALSVMLGANKVAAVSCVWVHNPITMGPMLYGAWEVGKAVSARWLGVTMSARQVEEILKSASAGGILANFHKLSFWRMFFKEMFGIGVELWVGCTILGAVSAALAYAGTYYFLLWHKRVRREK